MDVRLASARGLIDLGSVQHKGGFVLLQEDPSAEHLLDLAGRLDCCLRLHRREPALLLAEGLLETLCDHHRALHALRPRWDALAEHLDDLAVNLIAEVGLVLGDLRHGSHWPETRFREEVAEFLEASPSKRPSCAAGDGSLAVSPQKEARSGQGR